MNNNSLKINCILAGVGGQGTILASKLIAQAAIDRGCNARTAETIGMAQRGGCVVSHVRIGSRICSPMLPLHSADVLIGFEPAEAVRCLDYLKEGGVIVVAKRAVQPVTAALTKTVYRAEDMLRYIEEKGLRVIEVDGDSVCRAVGSAKVLNTALLGAAAKSGALGITPDEIKQTIKERVPTKFIDMNIKAFDLGAEFCN